MDLLLTPSGAGRLDGFTAYQNLDDLLIWSLTSSMVESPWGPRLGTTKCSSWCDGRAAFQSILSLRKPDNLQGRGRPGQPGVNIWR